MDGLTVCLKLMERKGREARTRESGDYIDVQEARARADRVVFQSVSISNTSTSPYCEEIGALMQLWTRLIRGDSASSLVLHHDCGNMFTAFDG